MSAWLVACAGHGDVGTGSSGGAPAAALPPAKDLPYPGGSIFPAIAPPPLQSAELDAFQREYELLSCIPFTSPVLQELAATTDAYRDIRELPNLSRMDDGNVRMARAVAHRIKRGCAPTE
jgi:hypothetical protein